MSEKEYLTKFWVEKEWLLQHVQDDKRCLKSGWDSLIRDKFRAHKPEDVFCSLVIMSNWVKMGTHKTNSPVWTAKFRCQPTAKSKCTRRYTFIIKDIPEKKTRLKVIVTFQGEHHHTKDAPVGAVTKNKNRHALKGQLQTKDPATLHRELLYEKAQSNKEELEAGNFDGAPSLTSLQKMSSENNTDQDLSKDFFQDLSLTASKLEAEFGSGSFFILSRTPFEVAWATDNMVKAMGATRDKPQIGFIDSTGSIVKKVPWDSKIIYNYELVIKEKGKSPTPVAEFISNDHHQYEISHWLARLCKRFEQVTGSDHLPFKIMVSDMSRAITNAGLQEFNGMSMMQYLWACLKAKQEKRIYFVVWVWCYSHLVGATKDNCKKWFPLKGATKFSPARKLIRFAVAAMAKTESVEEAIKILKPLMVITTPKFETQAVLDSVEPFALSLGAAPLEQNDEQEEEEPAETNVDPPAGTNVGLPKADHICSSVLETYKDSPFYIEFKKVVDSTETDQEDSDNLKPNKFYCPKLAGHLLKYYLPYYPLWSQYIQGMLIPNAENPLTNSAAELRMKQMKSDEMRKKTFSKVSRVVRRLVQVAEERIVELQYDTNIRKGSKKRKQTCDDGPAPNKREKEVWRPKANKFKLKGGLHSKKETEAYASHLLHKMSVNAPVLPDTDGNDGLASTMAELMTEPSQGPEDISSNPEDEVAACNESLSVYSLPPLLDTLLETLPLWQPSQDEGFVQTDVNGQLVQVLEAELLNENQKLEYQSNGITVAMKYVPNDFLLQVLPSESFVQTSQPPQTGACLPPVTVIVDANGVSWQSVDGITFMTTSPSGVQVYAKKDELLHSSQVTSVPEGLPILPHQGESELPTHIPSLQSVPEGLPILPDEGESELPTHIPSLQSVPTVPTNIQLSSSILEPEDAEADFLKHHWDQNWVLPTISHAVEANGRTLAIKDWESLMPDECLTDTMVDVVVRAAAKYLELNHLASVYVVDSSVLETTSLGMSKEFLEMIKNNEALLNDIWLVPSHIDRNHWVLFLVRIRQKEVIILDSMRKKKLGHCLNEHLKILMLFLSRAYNEFHGHTPLWPEWSFLYPKDLPTQRVFSNDCGVYVCLWALLSCGVEAPFHMINEMQSVVVRSWLGNIVKAFSKPSNVQNIGGATGEKPEAVSAWYSEIDQKLEDGTLEIDKPWKEMPSVKVKEKFQDGKPTLNVLQSIKSELWTATADVCGAPGGCRNCKGKMFLCEVHREWFHLRCVNDDRTPKNFSDKKYFCPDHIIVTSRTRKMIKPKHPLG